MRPYLSFPRGSRLPSPRILFYASDLASLDDEVRIFEQTLRSLNQGTS